MTSIEEMRNLFDVTGRVAVVTGAASGIGQGIAYAFAANGGKVVAADINREGLEQTVAEIRRANGDAIAVPTDITRVEDVRRLTQEALRAYARIDALYAVPSINVRKRIEDYTYEEFDRVVNVNLKGTFILLKEIGREIAKNREGGSIVVVSSIRHLVVEPGQSVYAATKAGMVQFARTLAAELGRYNVRVNAIAPGVVDTPLTQQIKNDPEWHRAYTEKTVFKRWASVREVAGPALFLATPAASYITASVLYVDGGWTGVDGRYEPKI